MCNIYINTTSAKLKTLKHYMFLNKKKESETLVHKDFLLSIVLLIM